MGAVSPVLQRRQVLYSGHVQGVGFRYTTRSAARNYEVTGYVRNLPDGNVEVVAEGSADQLDRFPGRGQRPSVGAYPEGALRPTTGPTGVCQLRHPLLRLFVVDSPF